MNYNVGSNSWTLSLSESCYNYDYVDPSIYVINTTRYDSSFSSNETYPDHFKYTLPTYTNYTSVVVEYSINNYRVDPDVQRYDNSGSNCLQSSILHHPKDGDVHKNWEYYFNKALLNSADTTGLYYTPSVSPNYGWITWNQNTTYIVCEGYVANIALWTKIMKYTILFSIW